MEVSTVRVAEAAGVTDAGVTPHLGIGDGPETEHVNAMAAEKPPNAGNVSASLTWLPRFTVSEVLAGVTEKSGAGVIVAVTVWFELSVTPQELGLLPEQAPLQLLN